LYHLWRKLPTFILINFVKNLYIPKIFLYLNIYSLWFNLSINISVFSYYSLAIVFLLLISLLISSISYWINPLLKICYSFLILPNAVKKSNSKFLSKIPLKTHLMRLFLFKHSLNPRNDFLYSLNTILFYF